jgi:hypothetical protein
MGEGFESNFKTGAKVFTPKMIKKLEEEPPL